MPIDTTDAVNACMRVKCWLGDGLTGAVGGWGGWVGGGRGGGRVVKALVSELVS